MEQVMLDCCGQCPPLPEDYDTSEDRKFVRGKLSFIEDNPGRQAVGSFNPIDDDEWATDALVPDYAQALIDILASDNVKALQELSQSKGFHPDRRDWLGRTPLLYATTCNSFQCAKFLIEETPAKISLNLPNGQTALHICAEHGLVDIAELFLRKNAENKAHKEARELAAKTKVAIVVMADVRSTVTTAESGTADSFATKSRTEVIDDADAMEYESITHEEAREERDVEMAEKVYEKDEFHIVDSTVKDDNSREETQEGVIVEDDIIDLDSIDWDYKIVQTISGLQIVPRAPNNNPISQTLFGLVELAMKYKVTKMKALLQSIKNNPYINFSADAGYASSIYKTPTSSLPGTKVWDFTMPNLEVPDNNLLQRELGSTTKRATSARETVIDITNEFLDRHLGAIEEAILTDEGYKRSGYPTGVTAKNEAQNLYKNKIGYPTRTRSYFSDLDTTLDELIEGEVHLHRLARIRKLLMEAANTSVPLFSEMEIEDDWCEKLEANDAPELEERNPLFTMYAPMTTPASRPMKKTPEEALADAERSYALGGLYHSLYELIWRGASSLEVSSFIAANNLLVYVQGPLQLTPFHVAAMQGNPGLLETILKIAIAQHSPNETDEERELRLAHEQREEEKRKTKPAVAVLNNYDIDKMAESDDAPVPQLQLQEEVSEAARLGEIGDVEAGSLRKATLQIPVSTHKTPVDLLSKRASLKISLIGTAITCPASVLNTEAPLNVFDFCIIRSDESLMRALIAAVQSLEFTVMRVESVVAPQLHVYNYYLDRFPADTLLQSLLNGGQISGGVLKCSSLAVMCSTPEFFKFLVSTTLCGVDIGEFLGLRRKTADEERQEALPAGAQLPGGRLKYYTGLNPEVAQIRDSAEQAPIKADLGPEYLLKRGIIARLKSDSFSNSMLHKAISHKRADLVPLFTNIDVMTDLCLSYLRNALETRWTTVLLSASSETQRLFTALIFGFVPQEVARREATLREPNIAVLPKTSGLSPFHLCIKMNYPSMIEVLASSYASQPETLALAAYQIGDDDDLRPFLQACAQGRARCAERLLEIDRHLSGNGSCARMLSSTDGLHFWTGLHFASFYGHHATVQMLVKLMEPAVARIALAACCPSFGHTPLMLAASQGRHQTMKILIAAGREAGVDGMLDAVEHLSGVQALHLAVRKQFRDAVVTLTDEMLADARARVPVNSSGENQAACAAAETPNPVVARRRVGSIIAVAHEDAVGLTPYQTASNVLKRAVTKGGVTELATKATSPRFRNRTAYNKLIEAAKNKKSAKEGDDIIMDGCADADNSVEVKAEQSVDRDARGVYVHLKSLLADVAAAASADPQTATAVVKPAVAGMALKAFWAAVKVAELSAEEVPDDRGSTDDLLWLVE
ncbi:hypothetical protein HK405_014678 [Cladochytrium tenue]|nr:hypothetical protein HK405_014678 [Cladochytrium tenue]